LNFFAFTYFVVMGDGIEEFKPKRPVVLGLFATGIVQVEAQPSNPSIKPPPIEIDTAFHFATDRQESGGCCGGCCGGSCGDSGSA
jgi:hypothetical protein